MIYECVRCGRRSREPFTWAHRPPDGHPCAGVRTCGGTVVLEGDVEATRQAERARVSAVLASVARAESSRRL